MYVKRVTTTCDTLSVERERVTTYVWAFDKHSIMMYVQERGRRGKRLRAAL